MSVIGKKPFVNKILSSLSAEQLSTLSGLLNNLGTPTIIKRVDGNLSLDNSLLGVHYVRIELFNDTFENGLLCYKDADNCGLFCFDSNSNGMRAYSIGSNSFAAIYEGLTVEEFRRCLDDETEEKGGSGDARAVVDPNDDEVVIYNSGLQVDSNGDVTIGRDLYVEDELVIDAASKIVDTDGNPISFGGKGLTGKYLHIIKEASSYSNFVLYAFLDTATPLSNVIGSASLLTKGNTLAYYNNSGDPLIDILKSLTSTYVEVIGTNMVSVEGFGGTLSTSMPFSFTDTKVVEL